MSFSFRCPACNHEYHKLEDSFRGKKIRCRCGKKVRLGQPVSSAAPSRPAETGKTGDDKIPEAIPVGSWPGSTIATPVKDTSSTKLPSRADVHDVHDVQRPTGGSIVRMLAGMVSGTLAILFSLLAFFFGGRVLQLINSFPPGPVAKDGLEDAFNGFLIGLNVYCITALLISIVYLFGGLTQIIVSWKQIARSNRSWWPDLLVVAVSMIAIVSVVATWSYLDVQTSQVLDMDRSVRAWGTKALASPGLTDEQAAKIREQLDEHERMLEGIATDVRWTLFRQLLIHAVVPCIVIGLSLFRLLRPPPQGQTLP